MLGLTVIHIDVCFLTAPAWKGEGKLVRVRVECNRMEAVQTGYGRREGLRDGCSEF